MSCELILDTSHSPHTAFTIGSRNLDWTGVDILKIWRSWRFGDLIRIVVDSLEIGIFWSFNLDISGQVSDWSV